VSLQRRSEHRFSWWHQGVLVFDRDYEWSEDFVEYVEAASGEWLDQSRSGSVTFISPGGAVFDSEHAPLTLEMHDAEPPVEQGAESVGDFDLRVRSGVLVMEESGGGEGRTEVPVPSGTWRARWSGFGQTALEKQDSSERDVQDPRPDRYLLQLWPTSALAPVTRLRS
jgi:hypothetical protein